MTFPVYFNLFGHRIHPHLVMELLAYTAGSQLYFLLRRRSRRPALPVEPNLWLIVGCIFGALFGSKLLALAESFPDYWAHRDSIQAWLGGKTIVGGLLGGWIGVEIAKKRLGIIRSTGDGFVFPLIAGMSIGRVGCFLTGLDDHTCGTHSSLQWAVDFGDGPRHPTQLATQPSPAPTPYLVPAVTFFAVALACTLAAWAAFRLATKRWMLLGVLLGAGVTSLVQGVCFMTMRDQFSP